MSRTILYFANEGGLMKRGPEFNNAWWGAMAVWISFGVRYHIIPEGGFLLGEPRKMRRVWALANDPAVPYEDRVSMLTTFDRCVVRAMDFREVARCLRHTAGWISTNHLGDQAMVLETAAGQLGIKAAGWQQTSVAGGLWEVADPTDPEHVRGYNLLLDTTHFWLHEAIALQPQETRDARAEPGPTIP